MKIFHSVASSRKRSNLITFLKIDGVETREPLILEKHVFQYYKNLLGTKGSTWLSFSNNIWADHEEVSTSENNSFIFFFTENEIKNTIFSMNPNKAPSPHGFSILFYQKF
jgi:hypothetical protein